MSMIMVIHLTLYLLGCGIRFCTSINFFFQLHGIPKIHEFVCIELPKRPLLSLIANSASARALGNIRKQIMDWLTRANICTGTLPPPSSRQAIAWQQQLSGSVVLEYVWHVKRINSWSEDTDDNVEFLTWDADSNADTTTQGSGEPFQRIDMVHPTALECF